MRSREALASAPRSLQTFYIEFDKDNDKDLKKPPHPLDVRSGTESHVAQLAGAVVEDIRSSSISCVVHAVHEKAKRLLRCLKSLKQATINNK